MGSVLVGEVGTDQRGAQPAPTVRAIRAISNKGIQNSRPGFAGPAAFLTTPHEQTGRGTLRASLRISVNSEVVCRFVHQTSLLFLAVDLGPRLHCRSLVLLEQTACQARR